MTPRNSALWVHAQRVRELCPDVFPSVRKAYGGLRDARRFLSNRGANFCAPCARDSSLRVCELQQQLKEWNRVLAPSRMQLMEGNAPGELVVMCVEGCREDRTWRLERAALLFHWLLTTHPCVVAMRLDMWGVFTCRSCLPLFCDGLRQCRRLRSLRLRMASLGSLSYYTNDERQELMSAVRNLHHLEEFTIDTLYVNDTTDNIGFLRDLITNNSMLNRLEVEQFYGETMKLWHIPRALATNVRVTDLCLDVGWLQRWEGDQFSLALKENRSLTSLRLVGSLRWSFVSMAVVAQALETATALTNLELSYFPFCVSAAWALVTSLLCNKSVQRLVLFACVPMLSSLPSVPGSGKNGDGLDWIVSWPMSPFVQMLRKLTSLRKLVFPVSAFPLKEQRAFFEALVANDSVEEVRVHSVNHRYLREFCRLVTETGIGNRVRIGTDLVDWRRLDSNSKKRYIQEVSVDEIGRPAEMHRWFASLSALNILTTLRVCDYTYIDSESAEILGQYLRHTQILDDIMMYFWARSDEELVLLDALSHNTSITALGVQGWCRSSHTARLLADVVCSSKKIRVLTYNTHSIQPSEAFLPALAQNIGSNRTILSVMTLPSQNINKHWNHIQKVLFRNHTLLVHAARFATGYAVTKNGAEAFELLSSSPMLVSKVREMASVGEKEAKEAISSRIADLDDFDFFMSVAGVVRGRAVCRKSSECCACLATLPYECWLIVRQYLRVADVVHRRRRC